MGSSSVRINLKTTCESSSVDNSLSLVLDNEKNTNKTRFKANETAYLRIYQSGLNPKLSSTMGDISMDERDLIEDIVEQIILTKSNSASLRYLPIGKVDYSWIGRDPKVTPQFTDKNITFSKEISGVLKVNYQTKYDSIELFSKAEGTILVEASTTDRYGSITVDFSGIGSNVKRPCRLTVKDACSKMIVAGAKIYVDDKYKGVTGDDGVINLGELSVGTHTIKATKEGYTDSDKDTILNDEFVVTEVKS